MVNLKGGDLQDRKGDRRGSGGELFITLRNVLFRGLLDEEEDLEKKAKIWRGWGAYEGEDGIGARKNGWEGEETGGEKMYRGLKSGLGTELVYYNGLSD